MKKNVSLENKIISKRYSVKDHTFFEFTTHYLVFRKNKTFQLFYIIQTMLWLVFEFFCLIQNFTRIFWKNVRKFFQFLVVMESSFYTDLYT